MTTRVAALAEEKLEKANFRASWKELLGAWESQTYAITSYFCPEILKVQLYHLLMLWVTYPAWKHEHFICRSVSPHCVILCLMEYSKRKAVRPADVLDANGVGNFTLYLSKGATSEARYSKECGSLEIREVSGRGEFFVLSVGFDSTFVCIQ